MKPGFTYGRTDDWGYKAIEAKVAIHDLREMGHRVINGDNSFLPDECAISMV